LKFEDGVVHIELDSSTGKHKGKHTTKQGKKRDLEDVVCTSGHVSFGREDDELGKKEFFLYDGDIVTDPSSGKKKIKNGKVKVKKTKPDEGDTGTWEATRQGGVPLGEEKGEQGRGRDAEQQSKGSQKAY
jgi:hypothetical protein